MIYLKSITKGFSDEQEFPYSVPSIAALSQLNIHSPVVFLVGANVSGKSTLLESITIDSNTIKVCQTN